MTGCLDAPEQIPLGAKASVKTVGAWYREKYLTLGREWEDWSRHKCPQAALVVELRKILDEVEY